MTDELTHPPAHRLERWLQVSLLVLACVLPVSIGLMQPPAYVATFCALALMLVAGRSARMQFPFRAAILAFVVVVIITALFGIRPSYSLKKIDRFLMFALVWGMAFVAFRQPDGGRRELLRWVTYFLVGLSFKAAYDAIRVPVMVSMQVSLFDTGNMRDPQIYMVGVCLFAGMLIARHWRWHYPPVAAGFMLCLFGLLVHFKRGSWLACLGAVVVMCIASRKLRPMVFAGLVVLSMAALPQVRERIGLMEREFDSGRGGRLLLWTDVAPALIKEYPIGTGWKALRHEDFLAINPKVESGLNHLHNNLFEIALEFSIAGLMIWLLLMALVIKAFWTSYRQEQQNDPARAGIALGGLGAFCGLMLNGMVEYNFGDKEIFVLILFLTGMAAALRSATLHLSSNR